MAKFELYLELPNKIRILAFGEKWYFVAEMCSDAGAWEPWINAFVSIISCSPLFLKYTFVDKPLPVFIVYTGYQPRGGIRHAGKNKKMG